MKIYDSLIHPSNSAIWFNNKTFDFTFDRFSIIRDQYKLYRACAVALPNMGFENAKNYFEVCNSTDLTPVFYYDFTKPFSQIDDLLNIGYRCIKIHLRLSKIDVVTKLKELNTILDLCEENNVKVFFCTYLHTNPQNIQRISNRELFIELFAHRDRLKVVFLHGFDTDILNMSQLLRFSQNYLLDISYTFLKFQGSSLDTDIKYLINCFDQKICLGSDWPDFEYGHFIKHAEKLMENIADEKKSNVCWRNLECFIND